MTLCYNRYTEKHQIPQHEVKLTLDFMSCLLSVREAGVCLWRAGEELELRPFDLTNSESFSSAVTKKFS